MNLERAIMLHAKPLHQKELDPGQLSCAEMNLKEKRLFAHPNYRETLASFRNKLHPPHF